MQTDELVGRLEREHADWKVGTCVLEAAAELRRLQTALTDASRTFHAIAAHDMGFSEDRNAARGWIERNGDSTLAGKGE